jgi:16S rRNA (adenine1518-N6/adenine1519-N6)-dimethyltransferase
MDLTNPQFLIPLLQSHGLYTRKKFGQHFLIDRSVLDTTLSAANIQSDDTILEVGAGTGVLTRELAQRAQHVVAFEIDTSLSHLLSSILTEFKNIDLQLCDAVQSLKDPAFLSNLTEKSSGNGYKFVANLPYNVGTHIIGQLITSNHPPVSCTVLLQREVAEKYCAEPPHATYLSMMIQTYGQASIVKIVNPKSFFPAPQVESAILHVSARADDFSIDKQRFSRFLHRGFAQPRKMLNKAFDRDTLLSANIDPNARPENVTFQQWLSLFKSLNPQSTS